MGAEDCASCPSTGMHKMAMSTHTATASNWPEFRTDEADAGSSRMIDAPRQVWIAPRDGSVIGGRKEVRFFSGEPKGPRGPDTLLQFPCFCNELSHIRTARRHSTPLRGQAGYL